PTPRSCSASIRYPRSAVFLLNAAYDSVFGRGHAFRRNTVTSPRKPAACRPLAAGDGPTRPSPRPSPGVAHEWRGDGVDVAELSGDLLRLSSSAGLTSTRFPGVPVEPD